MTRDIKIAISEDFATLDDALFLGNTVVAIIDGKVDSTAINYIDDDRSTYRVNDGVTYKYFDTSWEAVGYLIGYYTGRATFRIVKQ